MAVQAVVAERWKKVTGNVLTQAWGLTETSPAACINPIGLDFNGSIGLPIPSTDVSIRDDAGRELPLNQVGEICVFGPQLMRGYWNRPDETEMVMFGDWLRTGDIGRMDAKGFVYIEDRKKDMILVSGFNVYPNEIESVIAAHPGVLEVAAVAQADESSGEVVAIFVVKKDPGLTAEALIEYARGDLTRLQGPEARVLPAGTAENQRRQDPAARAARRIEETARPPLSGTRARSARGPEAHAGPDSRGPERSAGYVAPNRLDEHRDPLRIDVRRDAVPQIEHVAGSRPEALEHAQGLGAQSIARARTGRTDRDCPAAPPGPPTARRASLRAPWSSRPRRHRSRCPQSRRATRLPPLVKTMFGTRRPSASRVRPATIFAM